MVTKKEKEQASDSSGSGQKGKTQPSGGAGQKGGGKKGSSGGEAKAAVSPAAVNRVVRAAETPAYL